LYDLVATEAVIRLLDPGEFAMDVGANIGYMTAVMAAQLGPRGRVVSFEPSRQMYQELSFNAANWASNPRLARIKTHRLAVSSKSGSATLYFPESFSRNSGLPTLEGGDRAPGGVSEDVLTTDLDGFAGLTSEIALLKLDVEGHEPSVIEGARGLLSGGSLRDVVFEDHGPYPSVTQQQLRSVGFRIYRLSRTFGRPVLLNPESNGGSLAGFPPNFLATRDPQRVAERFEEPGWRTLRSSLRETQ
jgi:FkbM family methyltransferase